MTKEEYLEIQDKIQEEMDDDSTDEQYERQRESEAYERQREEGRTDLP